MRRRIGQVEQLPSGLWRARIRDHGRLVQLGPAVPSEAEAEAAIDGYLASHGTSPSALTLSSWGEQALEQRQLAGVRGISQEAYRWAAHVSADPIGGLAVRAVRRQDVVAWLARVERRGLSASTCKASLCLLRQVLQMALDRFGLEHNPAREVRVDRRRADTDADDLGGVLLPAEQSRLLAVVPARWLPAVRFALYVGARQGEQWELRWPDVELDRGRLVLRRSRGGLPTKGGRPRVVVAPPPVLADLQTLDTSTRWVFPGPAGGKHVARPPEHWHDWIRAAGITRPWHREPSKAELERKRRHPPHSAIRWHDLRHTCATSLLAGWWGRKWSIEEVKAYLAHSSVQVTERYARYVESLASDAVAGTAWGVTPDP